MALHFGLGVTQGDPLDCKATLGKGGSSRDAVNGIGYMFYDIAIFMILLLAMPMAHIFHLSSCLFFDTKAVDPPTHHRRAGTGASSFAPSIPPALAACDACGRDENCCCSRGMSACQQWPVHKVYVLLALLLTANAIMHR
jgi:hypothetical protein